MIKKVPLILIVLIFMMTFFYLHQKVQIYTQAYLLSKNYQTYNEFLDKRDYLRYNFIKEASLFKVNQWAENNNFSSVEKERLLVLDLRKNTEPVSENKIVFLMNRLLKLSTGPSALANEGAER